MNRPRSSRLANRHSPSSHQSTLIRSPRRPRNTNTCPPNGSCANFSCTIALNPVKPRRRSVRPAAIHFCVPAGSVIILAIVPISLLALLDQPRLVQSADPFPLQSESFRSSTQLPVDPPDFPFPALPTFAVHRRLERPSVLIQFLLLHHFLTILHGTAFANGTISSPEYHALALPIAPILLLAASLLRSDASPLCCGFDALMSYSPLILVPSSRASPNIISSSRRP